MIKQLLRYIVFLVPLPLTAQNANVAIARHAFKFADVEKRVTHKTIEIFIAQTKDSFPAYTDATAMRNVDELYTHLHFMDINGDGLDDVIFEGQSAGEGDIVEIFINTAETYKKVFEERQGITAVNLKNGVLTSLQVSDWGCCEDYMNFDKTFVVSFDGENPPTFRLAKQCASVFNGVEPDSLFIKPFKIDVLNSNYHLRTAPVIDDTSYTPWQVDNISRGSGNTIGLLAQGTEAVVLGRKKAADGREWFYVEIGENVPVMQSAFYENENKFPSKKRGWLSSRFVKLL